MQSNPNPVDQIKSQGTEYAKNFYLKHQLRITAFVIGIALLFFILSIAGIDVGYVLREWNWVLFCAAGSAISLYRRSIAKKKQGEESTLPILANDYYFQKYSSITMLSFMYAVIQGAALVGATYTLVRWIFGGNHFEWFCLNMPWCGFPALSLVGILLASILISRVILETYALLYKTARDLSAYARSHTH